MAVQLLRLSPWSQAEERVNGTHVSEEQKGRPPALPTNLRIAEAVKPGVYRVGTVGVWKHGASTAFVHAPPIASHGHQL